MRDVPDSEQGKFRLFRQSRWARLAIYLPILVALIVYGLRQVEFMVTYHPRPYDAGPEWKLPPNAEDVWISNAAGERLHGWLIHAETRPPLLTVLYCHGNGGIVPDLAAFGAKYAKRGFDTLVFDYRGYGRSEGALTDEWGLYADAEAAYDFLVKERSVKPEQLVVHGQSLGTTVAIDLTARRPAAALIVESGLSSASDMGRVVFPWLPVWLHFLGKNRFESARKIANVKCPVLITHGTADPVIPATQARTLYAAAHEPKQLLIVPGGDHNLFGRAGAEYDKQVTNFVLRAVKREALAATD